MTTPPASRPNRPGYVLTLRPRTQPRCPACGKLLLPRCTHIQFGLAVCTNVACKAWCKARRLISHAYRKPYLAHFACCHGVMFWTPRNVTTNQDVSFNLVFPIAGTKGLLTPRLDLPSDNGDDYDHDAPHDDA